MTFFDWNRNATRPQSPRRSPPVDLPHRTPVSTSNDNRNWLVHACSRALHRARLRAGISALTAGPISQLKPSTLQTKPAAGIGPP